MRQNYLKLMEHKNIMTESLENKNLTLKATKPPTKISSKVSNLPTNQPSIKDSSMPTIVPTILDFSSMPSFQASDSSSPTNNTPYEPYWSLNNKHLINHVAGAGAGLICIIAIACVGIYYELKSRSMKVANNSDLIFPLDDLEQQEIKSIGENSDELYA
jgi:hypothetical protein